LRRGISSSTSRRWAGGQGDFLGQAAGLDFHAQLGAAGAQAFQPGAADEGGAGTHALDQAGQGFDSFAQEGGGALAFAGAGVGKIRQGFLEQCAGFGEGRRGFRGFLTDDAGPGEQAHRFGLAQGAKLLGHHGEGGAQFAQAGAVRLWGCGCGCVAGVAEGGLDLAAGDAAGGKGAQVRLQDAELVRQLELQVEIAMIDGA
jgi:hypothetical protein